ncbi:MAG: hypothetical protein U0324_03635 [Polyangiales bacterium]
MNHEPTATPATPTLDALFALVVHALPPERRWMLEGWAAHLRLARHQNHAANSWAKHREGFAPVRELAEAFTLARIVDFGEKPDAAAALLRERVEARAEKLAAEALAPPVAARRPAPHKAAPAPLQPPLPLHAAA